MAKTDATGAPPKTGTIRVPRSTSPSLNTGVSRAISMTIFTLVGIFFTTFVFWVYFYALLISMSFEDGGQEISFREAVWLSLTGVLILMRVIAKPRPGIEDEKSTQTQKIGTKTSKKLEQPTLNSARSKSS